MFRIAILSDIHGNSIALKAVLDDIQKNGSVDAHWVLGDLAAIGHDPIRTVEMLAQLPNASFIRGNTDRYLVTGERPTPSVEDVLKQPERIHTFRDVTASFAWTEGALRLSGWMPWLEKLPLEMRHTLPDGTRFLGVHAAPGTDDGAGINPVTDQETLRKYTEMASADLVCVGHTHWPMDCEVNSVRIYNPGSISNPMTDDLRASYAILEADESGYTVQTRRVMYDHQSVIDTVRKVKHPAAEFIIAYQLGKIKPGWRQP